MFKISDFVFKFTFYLLVFFSFFPGLERENSKLIPSLLSTFHNRCRVVISELFFLFFFQICFNGCGMECHVDIHGRSGFMDKALG